MLYFLAPVYTIYPHSEYFFSVFAEMVKHTHTEWGIIATFALCDF